MGARRSGCARARPLSATPLSPAPVPSSHTGQVFVAQAGGAAVGGKEKSYSAVATDFNKDGALDLYVANEGQANELFWAMARAASEWQGNLPGR